jgi:hypothetical protein
LAAAPCTVGIWFWLIKICNYFKQNEANLICI